MALLFVTSKAFSQKRPVKLSRGLADLQRAIETLRAPKEERIERRQRNRQYPQAQTDAERPEQDQNMETEQNGVLSRPTHSNRNDGLRLVPGRQGEMFHSHLDNGLDRLN